MPARRAVIFDMDGVLVDSYAAHQESWQRLAAERGHQLTPQQFAATFGRTSREIIELLWGDARMSDREIAELDDLKEAYYREIVQREFPAMDGAADLIDQLHAAGFHLAVGSSGPPQNVALVLDRLDRGDRFAAVVTGMDVTRGKPDPQVFKIAAKRLEVPPAACVVVEDAPTGIQAASAAGMRCIGLVSTGRSYDELSAADLVVGTLRELTPQSFLDLIG